MVQKFILPFTKYGLKFDWFLFVCLFPVKQFYYYKNCVVLPLFIHGERSAQTILGDLWQRKVLPHSQKCPFWVHFLLVLLQMGSPGRQGWGRLS